TTRKSSRSTDVTTARLAVSLPCHGAEQSTTMWLYLIAFGKQHEELAKHKKGDLVQVHGNLQVNRYQDKFGQQKEGWQLLAQSIISSRTAR
ncbi:single-stranded DNA-binding protein, partial [Escherichia coli]